MIWWLVRPESAIFDDATVVVSKDRSNQVVTLTSLTTRLFQCSAYAGRFSHFPRAIWSTLLSRHTKMRRRNRERYFVSQPSRFCRFPTASATSRAQSS